MARKPLRIAITGAAGHIGYALIFRIAAGDMLGPDQPVILQMLELPTEAAQKALHGVMLELEDCAFPLLVDMVGTDDPKVAFKDADFALLVGARPRGPGMERADLLRENAKIFIEQGKALNETASRNVHVLVVGNPANSNAYITMNTAKDIPRENFCAMMRLDQNRAKSLLAVKSGVPVSSVSHLPVWGNHSPAMYPDISNAIVDGRMATDIVSHDWYTNEFIPTIANRGAEIIQARGLSSAASAANAVIDNISNWVFGSEDQWVSMGVVSDGSYGVPEGLMFGFPCNCDHGVWEIVQGLDIDDFSQQMLNKSINELAEERENIKHFLQ